MLFNLALLVVSIVFKSLSKCNFLTSLYERTSDKDIFRLGQRNVYKLVVYKFYEKIGGNFHGLR